MSVDASAIGIFLIIAGIVVIGIEFVHPGVFLMIPGTALLVAGILYIFDFPLLTQSVWGPILVGAITLLSVAITIPYYMYLGKIHRPMTTIPESLTGEVGVVISPVIPDTLKGKVRVQSEIWSARSERPIPAGTRVRVRGGQGVAIWVDPVEADTSGTAN